MKAIQRLLGLALALVVILGALAATSGSAQAVSPRPTITTSTASVSGSASVAGPARPSRADISAGGCGFLTECLFFDKSDQKWLASATTPAVVRAICVVTAGIGCVVAASVAGVVMKYVLKHGICPSSHPRLRITVFPSVSGSPTCVN
jgi:hypothetical protein